MRAALGPSPIPWPGRAPCGRILHRRSGPFSSSLLLQRGGTRPSSPEISSIFLNQQRPDTRLLSVAAFSMETYEVVRARDRRGKGRSGWADGVRSVAQGGARFPFGVRPGHAILCSCEHGVDRIRAMLNPSASNGAGLRDSAARPGIEAGRTKAVQDSAASANQTPMPSHGSRIGMAGPRRCRILPHRARPDHRTGSGPSAARTTPPGGGLSPRSGRRSPIRDLPGGQAARCRIHHQPKPPPLDLPAGP